MRRSIKNGFALNDYHTRAWTFQEMAVAKEIEFMGILGTGEEFYNLSTTFLWEPVNDDNADDELTDLITNVFFAHKTAKIGLSDKCSAFVLYTIIEGRNATKNEDMFYAILPVFDGNVVGKNHKEMWDAIYVKYQDLLLDYILEDFKAEFNIEFVEPKWFGMDNSKLLQSVVKPVKTKAYYKDSSVLIMNWTIGDRRVNVTIYNVNKFRREGNTWYFSGTNVSFEIGHKEEKPDKWKEYTFVYEPIVEKK